MKESFSEVLNDLIIDTGLSKRQVALLCNVTTSQMTAFLRGAVPSIETAVKFANYFDCSLNYLMGCDDDKHQTKLIRTDFELEHFLDRFNSVLAANKISHWQLCKRIGVSESNIRGWRKGAVPKLDTLCKIANYLNCSIDYLLGRAKS